MNPGLIRRGDALVGLCIDTAKRASESCSRPDRSYQPPHPCRPSSALASTHIGASAEPVLSLLLFCLLFFFLLLSTYGVPLAAPCLCPIEARWSSEIFAP
jgi:hypothetical protein